MPKCLFKPLGVDKLIPIRCTASGREDFSHYEASYRAREACRKGTAEFVLILEDGQLVGRWERTPDGSARQTAGKEYL